MARSTGASAKGPGMSLTKAALREQLRAEGTRHTSVERREGSRAICARLEAEGVWRNARTVLAFMPLESEFPSWANLLRICGGDVPFSTNRR